MTVTNKSLQRAKKVKNDEFYTRYSDVENELRHYKRFFKGKTILLPCDNLYESNFYKYFVDNFHELQLKSVIASCYIPSSNEAGLFSKASNQGGFYWEYDGTNKAFPKKPNYYKGSGDFRSLEVSKLFKKCDIVVTNPPFSLIREFFAVLLTYHKAFLFLAPINILTYKRFFPYFWKNRVRLGFYRKGNMVFTTQEGSDYVLNNIYWITSLPIKPRLKPLPLIKSYNPDEYPVYENYKKAIEVSRLSDIPKDYDGIMGVPITFFIYYNPDEYKIVGFRSGSGNNKDVWFRQGDEVVSPYWRVFIKRIK